METLPAILIDEQTTTAGNDLHGAFDYHPQIRVMNVIRSQRHSIVTHSNSTPDNNRVSMSKLLHTERERVEVEYLLPVNEQHSGTAGYNP